MKKSDEGQRLLYFFVGCNSKHLRDHILPLLSSFHSSPASNKYFSGGGWFTRVKIIMLLYACPDECRWMSREELNAMTRSKNHVTIYLMVKYGWLKRKYATFYTTQINLKKARMGNLSEPLE